MFWIRPGDGWFACVLFGLVNVGAAGSFVFYDALIVSVAAPAERDRLSTSAYAIGYLGGGVCLALCLALIQAPQWFGLSIAPDASLAEKSLPARIGFLLVACWWAGFSIPFFRRVREPELVRELDEQGRRQPVRDAVSRLFETGRELRALRHAFVFLLAFFAYNEGIGTVIRMAAVIGDERGIPADVLIQSILVVQFVGVPAALAFGKLAGWIGAKHAILLAVAVYVLVALLAWRLSTPGEFLVLAVLVGLVQGGAQALSRSLFASLVPPHKSGEFFGFFSTLEKFAGLAGPATFALAPTTGFAILVLVGFFVLGAVLLARVDVEQGRKAALAAEARHTEPGSVGEIH
jgi:UMF1 family MFS transporter